MTNDYTLFGLVQYADHVQDIQVQVHCKLSDKIDLPESIVEQFKDEENIMFVLNESASEIEFDFVTSTLQWNTSFGGVPFRLVIPSSEVIALVDRDGNSVILKNGQNNQNSKSPLKKSVPKKPKLELASYSAEPLLTAERAKLTIV